MQNDRSHLFCRAKGITQIFPEIKLLVLMALFASIFIGAKSIPSVSGFQQVVVTGTVKDLQGQPITGVTVMVKGSVNGTLTDLNGKYTLNNVPTSATLSFTFIGMATQEIALNGQTRIDVVMREATLTLEEVVVVGYGTQKKESVVGAIAQTSNEQLKKMGNVSDFKQALTGQLPGITTITSSGEPGGTGRGESATSIFIRGMNTWNGGQPLILVDGVERRMDNLDVSEVESISVLKDASATAVFGVKGANGVIMITSKRGSQGKPQISFTYNATAKSLSKVPKTMNSYDALGIRNLSIEREVSLNEPSWGDYIADPIRERFKQPQTPEYALIYPDVNWEKALFDKIGWSHRADVNVQGGTGIVSYFGTLAYLHEGDMFKEYDNGKEYKPNYNYDRFNFRSNLDFKLSSTTTLKINLSGYYSQKNTNYNNEGSTSAADQWMWAAIYGMPPDIYLPQYPDGRWGWSTIITKPNPVACVYNLGIRQTRTTQLNSDYSLEQNLGFITKGLTTKAALYYDNQITSEGGTYEVNHIRPNESGSNTPEKMINWQLYTGPTQDPSIYMQDLPTLGTNQFDWGLLPYTIRQEVIGAALWQSSIPVERRLQYQFQVNYARKFGKHNVSALALFKRQEYARGSMFKNYREDWVFRATYDYATRYLFEVNGAYNGSEQFGSDYRFDFFPSVALGWVVTNEKFFKVDWINKLKFRYSLGMVGDDDVTGGARWLYSSQMSYGGRSSLTVNAANTSPYYWYRESVVGNPDIRWEKAKKNDFGIELGLLRDLVSVNYDYFSEDRTDMLISGGSRAIPPFFGATPPSANLGAVKNHGHEIELKIDKRFFNQAHLWTSFTYSHIINKVINRDDPPLLDDYLKAKGYPIAQTRTQVRAGFYNNWDQIYASVPTESNDLLKIPGFYNIVDFNGDGVIKGTDDAIPFGYSEIPQNSGSINLGADYKGFSFMIQFYGVNNVSHAESLANFSGTSDVVFAHVYDHWTKTNQNASSYVPRWKTSGTNIGDYFVYDASFIRLKTTEIAYTFDSKFLKKYGLGGLRLYINGNNLYFWSDLPDDREAAWSGGSAGSGTYPTVKRVNLGIDVTF